MTFIPQSAGGDLTGHLLALDPHPQYLPDGDFTAHVNASDPHPQYTLETDARLSDARAPLPHTHPGSFAWDAVVRQAADVTHAAASFVNSDLMFSFAANSVYVVDLYLLCTAAAATTGFRFGFDVSAAVSAIGLTFFHVLANTGTVTGGSSIADDAAAGLSLGVPTAAALTPIIGQALIVTGASAGTARLRFGPEVAASATLKANSTMRVHKVA